MKESKFEQICKDFAMRKRNISFVFIVTRKSEYLN